ncbi:hypothetical protein PR202_gb25489 [Eleusine coracana subsp. coracana]|uniref:Uncharacterized protein n=1 Tax=Eleusine coracana subsp. coracana TaxID=191504 RepID=A0AAV5FLC7_ELECO|nr:hypothetical protein PR202_gb25489 [Eleusine coracana subsp. coracana]
MIAKQTRMIDSMSMQQIYGHSAAIVLLWPTTYTYAWLQQPGLGSLICLPIPSALG